MIGKCRIDSYDKDLNKHMVPLPTRTSTVNNCQYYVDGISNDSSHSRCNKKTITMLMVCSVLWAGLFILAVSTGLVPGNGKDAIKQLTVQFRATTHETHRGSLADRLADLERLSGELAERVGELEKRNHELQLLVTKQSPTDPEQNMVLQQLVGQMEKGMAFLFPDFQTDISGDTEQADRDEKVTKSRMAVLRDYLGNREAEFAVMRQDHAPWETLRGTAEDKDIDLAVVGLALRQLSNKNVELSKEVEEMKMFQGTRVRQQAGQHADTNNVVMEELIREMEVEKNEERNSVEISANGTRKSAFAVASSHSQLGLQGTAQNVAFDHSFTNKGGDFDLNNNTFICRIPGFYHFTFTMRTYDHRFLSVVMMKNDEPVVAINTDQSDRSVSCSQTAILRLYAGDSVWLRMPPSDSCGIYSDGSYYTTFNGFLLYASTS
ncbi:uncharacterized protein LOC117298292 isoform X2 [Asterias rubens]|uniref:uncharacterized protein LOC117298292 isoform X2 n=1 Tax=Asterias rubens TaxID=7604 RepID=UPI00145593C1|nr:uncharacterized protein LOC117298292 isoform X2 [Asterias rubens]